MKEALYQIASELHKNWYDYFFDIVPLIISFFALAVSIKSVSKKKKITAKLIWDDLSASFFIIIRNIGNQSVVIEDVSFIATNGNENFELGKRNNAWLIKQEKSYIEPNEAITISPIYGSIYDVFAYSGHALPNTTDYNKLKVKIITTDVDGKKWVNKTCFTLADIDEKLPYAVTAK